VRHRGLTEKTYHWKEGNKRSSLMILSNTKHGTIPIKPRVVLFIDVERTSADLAGSYEQIYAAAHCQIAICSQHFHESRAT